MPAGLAIPRAPLRLNVDVGCFCTCKDARTMSADVWVNAAQIASGIAALVAVWVAIRTASAGRRAPLADAYLTAWQSILEVAGTAAYDDDKPPSVERANALMKQFELADQRLTVIEATLGVRLYGRDARFDLANFVHSALFDDPEVRDAGTQPLSLSAIPRPDWAHCSDEEWLRVANSVPFASMLVHQVWSVPGDPDNTEGLMKWYYPVVLRGLDTRASVTSSSAPAQQQLSFFLSNYVDSFVLPWIRDAAREALLGRVGLRGRLKLWRRTAIRWRRTPPWRARKIPPSLMLFNSTDRN